MITQHHRPDGQVHHRVVVDLGPVPESFDPESLKTLAMAEATQRCVPDCFPRGAFAKQVGSLRESDTNEVPHLSAIVYVSAR